MRGLSATGATGAVSLLEREDADCALPARSPLSRAELAPAAPAFGAADADLGAADVDLGAADVDLGATGAILGAGDSRLGRGLAATACRWAAARTAIWRRTSLPASGMMGVATAEVSRGAAALTAGAAGVDSRDSAPPVFPAGGSFFATRRGARSAAVVRLPTAATSAGSRMGTTLGVVVTHDPVGRASLGAGIGRTTRAIPLAPVPCSVGASPMAVPNAVCSRHQRGGRGCNSAGALPRTDARLTGRGPIELRRTMTGRPIAPAKLMAAPATEPMSGGRLVPTGGPGRRQRRTISEPSVGLATPAAGDSAATTPWACGPSSCALMASST
ncbi:hypothetical protein GCM10010401_12830 [Rarobacter faecitabidus]